MISATEQRLIETMIGYGAKDELIHLLCSALSTAQQENAIYLMRRYYQKHGEITEEDLLKVLLILTKPF